MQIVCDPSYEFAMRTPSAGEAAGVEKGLLVRCRSAAEHRVAMRETAEAADDVGVELGPFQQFGVARPRAQREASFLIGERFGMLERQIEELALGSGTSRSKPRSSARSATARASASAA